MMLHRMRGVGAERGQRGLELLLLADQQAQQLVDLAQRRRRSARWLSVATPRSSTGQDPGVDQQPVDRPPCGFRTSWKTRSLLLHQLDHVLAAVGEQRGDALRALQQRLDLGVARGDGLARAGRSRRSWPGSRERTARSVEETTSSASTELLLVDLLGRRGEVAEDADDVVRRLGALLRDRRVLGRAGRSPAGVSSRYFSPSRLSTSTEALLSLPNSTPLSTSNSTITVSPLERDLLDAADPDAADLHHVAAVDAAGVGELGGVRACRRSPGTWTG